MADTYTNTRLVNLCCIFLILYTHAVFSQTTVTKKLMQGEVMKDGQIITSDNQVFGFGFFSPVNSSFRYVGVWYNKIQEKTVLWVANRNKPISGKSGFLSFGSDGNLKISDGTNVIWSTTSSSNSSNNSIALMDTGNLALCRSEDIDDSRKALWQSFSWPTDTFLPEMRVYTKSKTQNLPVLVSWRSPSDPSPGNYSVTFHPRGAPQVVVWKGLNHRLWRSGHWNGQIIGVPNNRARFDSGFGTTNDYNTGDTFFTYTATNRSLLVRFTVSWNGVIQQLIWNESKQVWNVAL